MEPGSPAFGHWADPRAGCPKGSGGLLAMASLHPLVAVLAAADRNRKARRHRTHLPQVDLELLGQGLELELAAAVRAARRRGASSSRSTGPVGAMRWPWRPWASPLRLPGFAGSSFGSPLENGAAWRFPNGGTRRAAAPALRHGHHARQGAPHARPSGRSAPGARRCWPREAGEAERSQRPTPCRSWVLRPKK